MEKNYPLSSKSLFWLIFLICINVMPLNLKAQVTENFTGEVNSGTTFSEGGASFSLTGSYLKVIHYAGFGWTGSAADDDYVDNYYTIMPSAGIVGSIKNVTKNFYVNSLYVAPGDDNPLITNTAGNVIIRGKLAGTTKFTYTLLSDNVNVSGSTNNYFTFIDLSSYNSILIDELEFEVTGGLRYLALDAFKFTLPVTNNAPTDIVTSASAINENVAANSTVGTLSSTDLDAGNTFTYTLVSGTGSTDNASFNISGSSLRITNSPDFEVKNSYSVRVRTTDQGGLYFEKAFTITINDVNEAPTDIALSASSINENVVANSTVGTLSSTDPDAANTFTYTLVSGTGSTDNASFNISGSSLRITNSPDFEAKNSYSVRVRTTDQGGLYFEKAFTITINDVNEAPTDIALSASSINENVVANSTVGTLSSTDPDAANTFTYTLVSGTGSTDNASFNISGSNLRITNSPDFETKNSYSVRVRTTDQGGLYFEKAFTISINNVNEAPIDIALSASSINENVAANSTVGTLSSTDPDAGNTFTYTLVSGTGSADNASFNISGSSLRITNSPDFEAKSSYTVRVRATDQGGLYFEKAFTISINDVNEAPTDITLSASSINENVAANSTVGTLSSTDTDADNTFTYTLVFGTGSTDNASFNISGSSLRITNSPDFEAKSNYTVRVRTTDQGGLIYEKTFTVTINDVNDNMTSTITTQAVTNINVTTATGNGNITNLGVPNPIQYGVVWSTSTNPIVSLSTKTTEGTASVTGAFTSSITGLAAGTTYYVKAYATNSVGTVYGDEVNFTTITVPDAPTISTTTAGDTQVSVSFAAPVFNGGSTITGYTVTSSPGNFTGTGTTSPITVTGLTNSVAYTFTIKAANIAGTSAASAASNSVTPKADQTISFANPGSKNFGTSPTLVATANSGLAVTFTTSTPDVCSITSYGTLTFKKSGTCTVLAGQAGDAAYNAAAQVSQSFTVNAVVPDVPTMGIATVSDGQASVSFTPSVSNGGADVTYTVTSNPGNKTGTGTISPITVTGLTNGTAYTFTATAANTAGTSAASAASNSVSPKAGQTISFANPGSKDFGTSPTLVATASSSLTVTFTTSTPDVCSITSGGTLTFKKSGTCTVLADQAGDAAYHAAPQVSQSFTVNAVVPDVPIIGTATVSDGQASVSFAPSVSNGGADVMYTVTSNPGNKTGTGTISPITVTGLTNGTAYTFTVTAANTAGTSAASGTSNSVTPHTLPTATTDVATDITSSGVTLNGTINANGASTAVTFEYGTSIAYGTSVAALQSPVSGVSATSVSKALTGLLSNTTYHYRVVGVNEAGTTNGPDQTFTTALNTGLDNPTSTILSLYPNPTADGFYINAGDEPVALSFCDLSGSLLLTQQVARKSYINVSSLPKGVYLVKANGLVGKLVKK